MVAATTPPDEETCRAAQDAGASMAVREAKVDEGTLEARVAVEAAAPPGVGALPRQPTHECIRRSTECYMVERKGAGCLNWEFH